MQEFEVERYDATHYLVTFLDSHTTDCLHGEQLFLNGLLKLTLISHSCDIAHRIKNQAVVPCGWQLNARL